jgi:hypothetical protein
MKVSSWFVGAADVRASPAGGDPGCAVCSKRASSKRMRRWTAMVREMKASWKYHVVIRSIAIGYGERGHHHARQRLQRGTDCDVS